MDGRTFYGFVCGAYDVCLDFVAVGTASIQATYDNNS